MAEPAQPAEEGEVQEEEELAFAGLSQSTPVKSRSGFEHLMMVLTSPAGTAPRTKPSTSGTYLALPPTWTSAQVSITNIYICLNVKQTYSHSHSIV